MNLLSNIGNSINRSLVLRLLSYILILAIAASVCVYGSFYIVLKGPYDSYGPKFVKQVCTETRFGFICRSIIGDETVDEIMENAVREEQEQ